MALITRRPRLTLRRMSSLPSVGPLPPPWRLLGSSLMLFAAACSLVKPVETPVDKQAEAAQLVSAGRHADAAQAYADLANEVPAQRDNYELLSAEQWVSAGNVAAAKQAYAAVSPSAATTLPTSRALIAAEIALAEKDGARALRELDTIAVPTAPDLAQNYWYLRGESAFLAGRPVDGTRVPRARNCSTRFETRPSTVSRSSRRRKPILSSPAGWPWGRRPCNSTATPCMPTPRSTVGSASIPAIRPTTAS
jgi:hypothetical protein